VGIEVSRQNFLWVYPVESGRPGEGAGAGPGAARVGRRAPVANEKQVQEGWRL